MTKILPYEKVVEIVHRVFSTPEEVNIERDEVLTDEQIEEMATEAYNKYKKRMEENNEW